MASHPYPNPNQNNGSKKTHHPTPRSGSTPPAGDAAWNAQSDEAFANELAKLRDRIYSLLTRLGRAEETADGLLQTIDALVLLLSTQRGSTRAGQLVRLRQIKGRLEDGWKQMAETGTSEFRLALHGDGTVTAQINGKKVRLSKTLGQLLIVLASDTRENEDDIVAWKTYSQVSRILSRKLGREMRPGAIRMSISRLRDRLAEALINPYFVQTRPVSRVRFALRRRSAPPAA